MGWTNASFVAQRATEMTYSQETMLKFLKKKGWKINSDEWPFKNVMEFLILYLDDICVYSLNNIPNHIKVHFNIIEFLLYATVSWGFKIGPAKFHPWVTQFKFLGHYFDVHKATTGIPPERLNAIKNFRAPASTAECLSRLGVIAYFKRYVPLLQIVAMPLHQMCLSGKFEWTNVHQQAWQAIKLLCSLNFENNVIDENRTLILACDSSQISISWVMFQIIHGEIKLISLDSKILKGSDWRKAAPFRE